MVHPANAAEARALVRWAVEEAEESVAIRLAIGPSPRLIALPEGHEPVPGRGWVARAGDDAVVLTYGPVMLNEALVAAELLASRGIELRVIVMPWLDRVDPGWLIEATDGFQAITVLEDHAPEGALGDALRRALAASGDLRPVDVIGIEGWPACGTPPEALRHHGLDGASLAERLAAAQRA